MKCCVNGCSDDAVVSGSAPHQDGDYVYLHVCIDHVHLLCDSQAISGYFELTYAHWLTLPRVFLEAMPDVWQEQFVKLLREFDARWNWKLPEGRYWVGARDGSGKLCSLPDFPHYRHPGDLSEWLNKEA